MGLQRQFKEIEQKAKHLPVIFDEHGKTIDHAKRMKDLCKRGGVGAVNDYIKEIFYACKMAELQNQKQHDDGLQADDCQAQPEHNGDTSLRSQ
jgi:hypothetical protein